MDNKTATFTFTFYTLLLLYTGAARPAVDLSVTNPIAVRTDAASDGSKILLPREKVISDETTGNILHPEMEKTSNNNLTPHTNFSRFHPINRHFQGRPHQGPKQTGTQRRPCLRQSHFMIPATKISGRKEPVAPERTDNSRSKTFRGEVPKNWLKAKHHYGFHPQDNNHNHTNNNHHEKNVENVMKPRNVFDPEKMKSLSRKQNQMKSDYKAGLMKNIRKFLKHTFD